MPKLSGSQLVVVLVVTIALAYVGYSLAESDRRNLGRTPSGCPSSAWPSSALQPPPRVRCGSSPTGLRIVRGPLLLWHEYHDQVDDDPSLPFFASPEVLDDLFGVQFIRGEIRAPSLTVISNFRLRYSMEILSASGDHLVAPRFEMKLIAVMLGKKQ